MGFSRIQYLYKIPCLDLNLNIFKMQRNHLNQSKTQNLQTNTNIFLEQMKSSITLKGKMLSFSDQSLTDTPSTLSSYHHHHTAKPVLQVSDLYLNGLKLKPSISTYRSLSAGTETKAQQTST